MQTWSRQLWLGVIMTSKRTVSGGHLEQAKVSNYFMNILEVNEHRSQCSQTRWKHIGQMLSP